MFKSLAIRSAIGANPFPFSCSFVALSSERCFLATGWPGRRSLRKFDRNQQPEVFVTEKRFEFFDLLMNIIFKDICIMYGCLCKSHFRAYGFINHFWTTGSTMCQET